MKIKNYFINYLIRFKIFNLIIAVAIIITNSILAIIISNRIFKNLKYKKLI